MVRGKEKYGFVLSAFQLILFCLVFQSTVGQVKSEILDYVVYNKIYDQLLLYESDPCKTTRKFEIYKSLFADQNYKIPNDILADNNLRERVSIGGYCDRYDKFCKTYYSTLNVLQFSPIKKKSDSTLLVDVLVDKRIENRNNKKDGFKYKDTLHYKISFSINTVDTVPTIETIEYTEDPGKYVRFQFDKSWGDTEIYFDNRIYSVDSSLEMFTTLMDTSIAYEWVVLDRSVIKKEEFRWSENNKSRARADQDKNIHEIKFKSSDITLGFRGGYASTNAGSWTFNLPSENTSLIQGLAQEMQLDLALAIKNRGLVKSQVRLGLLYSNYDFRFSDQSATFAFSAVDPDGGAYIRKISFNHIRESHSIQNIAFPLLFDFSFFKSSPKQYNLQKKKWKPKLFPYLYFGGVFSVNLDADYSVQGEAEYNGYYEELFGYTFQDGLYDFGTYQMEGAGELNRENYNLAFMAGLGIKLNVNNAWNFALGLRHKNFIDDFIVNSNQTGLADAPGPLLSTQNIGLNYSINHLSIEIGIEKRL